MTAPPPMTAPSITAHLELNEWVKDKGFAVIRANRRNKHDAEYSRYDIRWLAATVKIRRPPFNRHAQVRTQSRPPLR